MNSEKNLKIMKAGDQILKSRDDPTPVLIESSESLISESNKPFKVNREMSCSWSKADQTFGPEKLRPRIEPWMTALVQSEHLSMLIGSGMTHAVHGLVTNERLSGMTNTPIDIFRDEIEADAKRAAKLAGRDCGNIEDKIRSANELLRGLEILALTKEDDSSDQEHIDALRNGLRDALSEFANDILRAERNIVTADSEKRERAFNYLVSFLMSFASRTGTRDRLHLFTTNYDRFIEAGADLAGLRLIDRFIGTLEPVFRASRLDIDLHYNPPGIRGEPRYLEGVARFTKLHGSIDWVECGRSIRRIGVPMGVQDLKPYLDAPGLHNADAMRLMIYPNAAKDRETAAYPYVELFRDFAAAICRPNSTLVSYGYSFGDEHINRVIEDMLTIPSTHLVIIAHGDPLGRIMRTYEKLGRHAQITLLLGNHLGNLQMLVDHYLPKPAIDRTTFRMAELLRARWDTEKSKNDKGENDLIEVGDSEL